MPIPNDTHDQPVLLNNLSSFSNTHPSKTTDNAMSQNKESHSSATARSPDMPRRQRWNTDDILCMGDDFTHADAVKEITFLWNEWADSAENILRAMIDQMEDRAVSRDDGRTLAARVSAYPARPALPAVGVRCPRRVRRAPERRLERVGGRGRDDRGGYEAGH